jgi:hypothetical protein
MRDVPRVACAWEPGCVGYLLGGEEGEACVWSGAGVTNEHMDQKAESREINTPNSSPSINMVSQEACCLDSTRRLCPDRT